MRRFPIWRLMVLVALLAADCAAARAAVGDLRATNAGRVERGLLLLGLLPLGNVVIAALAAVGSRYRVAVRRRSLSRKPPLVARFAGWGGAVLLGALGIEWLSPYTLDAQLEMMAGGTISTLAALGWGAAGSMLDNFLVEVIFVALSASGPLLLLTALLATIPYQVEIALTRRTDAEPTNAAPGPTLAPGGPVVRPLAEEAP